MERLKTIKDLEKFTIQTCDALSIEPEVEGVKLYLEIQKVIELRRLCKTLERIETNLDRIGVKL